MLCCEQDKRVAGEQEKSVNAEAVKIGKEAEEANAIASQVRLIWTLHRE
jgi:dynein heavy chain